LDPLDLYLWGQLKTLMQLPLTTKRHFTIALWMPVRLPATTPAPLNGCCGPWWDVSRRALNIMEDLLYMYSFSYNSQIKCFRTHVDMDICSCFCMWNSCQSLSAPFSYTLYVLLPSNVMWKIEITRRHIPGSKDVACSFLAFLHFFILLVSIVCSGREEVNKKHSIKITSSMSSSMPSWLIQSKMSLNIHRNVLISFQSVFMLHPGQSKLTTATV
jgi:hypothetical protein